MSDLTDISDLREPAVLAALYNRAQPQGLGHLHYRPEPMTLEQAEEVLLAQRSFDYLVGRVMKISFFDAKRQESETNKPGHLRGAWAYDRDNGQGAVAAVLAELRAAATARQASG